MTGTLNRTLDECLDKRPSVRDFYGINQQTSVLESADKIFTLYNVSLYLPDFLCENARKLIIYPVKAKAPILRSLALELKPHGEIVSYYPREVHSIKEVLN